MRSVIETTERFSAIPPPFNLPVTSFTLGKYYMSKWLDPEAGQRWDTVGAKTYHELLDVSKQRETALELKEAKKAKAKVARKLLFAFKRQQEDAEQGLDAIAENVAGGIATQNALGHSMKDMSSRMERMEKMMERMTSPGPASHRKGPMERIRESAARAPASSAPVPLIA